MATIKEREGKNGISYLIRVSGGYNIDGEQVVQSMTWKPTPGMTAKQIEKELRRQAVLFEEHCSGRSGGGSVKFETFAKQWFQEYAEHALRPRTIDSLHQLEGRVYAAIGHIHVDKLNGRNIQSFINNLSEDGVRVNRERATIKKALGPVIKEKGLTQRTLADASRVSRTTISAACRGTPIAMETAQKIAKALGVDTKVLFSQTKPIKKLSPKTIRNYHGFISSVLSYAVRMGIIQNNPARNVALPPMEQGEKECYTIEEAQHFLDTLEQAPSKYRAFFILAIYGGFRRGELLGLEWSDLDFENCIVTIRRTSQYTKGRGVFTDTTKTAKSRRSLKLPASVFAVLRQHRATQAQERLLMGDRWNDTNRLFVTAEGQPMRPNTPYYWLKDFCKSTGQRFLGVHQFRHLNASLLINSGADPGTVSSSLGHSQISTTLNIYTHTFAEAQARAGEAVAAALDRGIKTG